MPQGYSNSAKSRAARGMIGTAGLQVRVHSGDPGSSGTSNVLSSAGGYQHKVIGNGDITVSSAGVVANDNQEDFVNPTGDWSAAPTWISVWANEGTPVHLANIDITDIARPGSSNTVHIPAGGISLNPVPSPNA